MKELRSLPLALALSLSLTGCVIFSYTLDPDSAWDAKSPGGNRQEVLHYSIAKTSGFTTGGVDELKKVIQRNNIFQDTVPASEPPAKGLYVAIDPKWHDPSIGSMVWGYIALVSLFMLPAYNGSSGYDVQYQVYRDGKKIKLYEYSIRRKGFAWLPVIPFVWVNLLTADEDDAFIATMKKFFEDAKNDKVFEASS